MMEVWTIQRCSAEVYHAEFPKARQVFGNVSFIELNSHKTDAVHYLLFRDTKTRFGVVLGERDGVLCSPFSAPFGGLEYKRTETVDQVECAYRLLADYARGQGFTLRITLPPIFYDPTFITHQINVLSRLGRMAWMDLNYSFSLALADSYESLLTRAARNKLHQALKTDFRLVRLNSGNADDVARAYRVIAANRQEHGYPLRMSLNDVLATVKIVTADFFVLTLEDKDVAAAQIFHVADGICQVIYWGDLHAYASLRTMNRLSYELFHHYRQQNLRLLDIGPSSEEGTPSVGLCSFKESIGCTATPKFVFTL